MRAKIAILVILPAVLIVMSALMWKHRATNKIVPIANPESVQTQPTTDAKTETNLLIVDPASKPAPVVAHSSPQVSETTNSAVVTTPVQQVTPEQHQEMIDAETARLRELAMSDDPTALPPILAGLTNSVKEIRVAAMEAAEQFGSRDAVPALKAAAANTTDPEERDDLLEAADFLDMPSLSDLSAAFQTNAPGK